MIRGDLIHPQILASLAAAGHGSQILVADALYPHSSGISKNAERVHLNFTPGLVAAQDVVRVLSAMVNFEAALYMKTPNGQPSEQVLCYQMIIANQLKRGDFQVSWSGLARNEFYTAARGRDVTLLIATGDVRPYSNLLLTIGVP